MNQKEQIIEPVILDFGMHSGRSLHDVVINYPDYIHYLSSKPPLEGFDWLYDAIEKEVKRFDLAPFLSQIHCIGEPGCRCTNPVTRFAFISKRQMPSFLCGNCDPCRGTNYERTILSGYHETLDYVHSKGGRSFSKQEVIRSIARTKGFRIRLRERADEFEDGRPCATMNLTKE